MTRLKIKRIHDECISSPKLISSKKSTKATGLTRRRFNSALMTMSALAASGSLPVRSAIASEPIKIGFGMAQSGPLGGNGKAALLAIEMWRDNINARGGLLGRPVQLVYYDDQTNPALIPGIYSKLFDVDKVDLVLGGYGTAVQAAALPIVMQRKQVLIGTGAVAVNEKYKYDKYFQMLPNGSTARTSTSEGFFQAAMTMDPKPKTVAIVGAVTEFSRNVILGARENAEKYGLKVVYDGGYPPNQMEFGSILRSVQAANPEVVFVASYPPDSAGVIRTAYEQKLQTRMFGGAMIGLQYSELKQQLGPMLNNVLCYEFYVPAPTTNFPGIKEFLATYQERAKKAGADLLGFYSAALRLCRHGGSRKGGDRNEGLGPKCHRSLHPRQHLRYGGWQSHVRTQWRLGQAATSLCSVSRDRRQRPRTVQTDWHAGHHRAAGVRLRQAPLSLRRVRSLIGRTEPPHVARDRCNRWSPPRW